MLTRAEIEITAKTIFMALFLLEETGKNWKAPVGSATLSK